MVCMAHILHAVVKHCILQSIFPTYATQNVQTHLKPDVQVSLSFEKSGSSSVEVYGLHGP